MAREIERKFLVDTTALRLENGQRMQQGYLPVKGHTTVRVRIAGRWAWLTIKGPAEGASRAEFEYAIPVADADEMLATLCEGGVVDKHRYRIEHAGRLWEVDVFHGDNEGLVVAEIELDREDEPFERPPWVTEEVTGDPRYFNASLIERPYTQW